MSAKQPPTVFISHSSFDKQFVRRLASDLGAHGITCWVDDPEIKPGDDFVAEIEDGLAKAATILVVLSHHSIISSWVLEETHAAQIWAIHDHTRLIPVLLGKMESIDIPLLLKSR